jgi:hypothetical protein
MLKTILILIFLPSLFLFSDSEKPETASDSFPAPNPTKTSVNEKESGVENLILEEDTVYIICPGDTHRCTEDNLNIKVNTFSKDAEKNNLKYYYTVTGGKIIGEGANVIWNFSETRPGKYTITASVGKDNIIYGKTVTKTIDLEECPECYIPCECPTINVSGPTKPIKAGDSFIVTAKVSGGSQDSVEYRWKITDGKIISGQNAAQIIVKTDPNKKDFILTATVEINGLCASCPTEDSETFKIE